MHPHLFTRVREWKQTIDLHWVSYTCPCPFIRVRHPVSVHGWDGDYTLFITDTGGRNVIMTTFFINIVYNLAK